MVQRVKIKVTNCTVLANDSSLRSRTGQNCNIYLDKDVFDEYSTPEGMKKLLAILRLNEHNFKVNGKPIRITNTSKLYLGPIKFEYGSGWLSKSIDIKKVTQSE